MSETIKEYNFIKQVERQSKHDAYEAAYCWGKSDYISKEDLMKFLKEKMQGHESYLKDLPFEYDYATQTLVPKRQYTQTVTG